MQMRFSLCRLVVGTTIIAVLLNRSLLLSDSFGVRWGYVLAAIVLMLLLVRSLPFARHRENLWLFLLVFVTTAVFNVRISAYAVNEFLTSFKFFLKCTYAFWLFLALLAAEEIILGIMARIFWKKQGRAAANLKKNSLI